jgi:hypothetical protein
MFLIKVTKVEMQALMVDVANAQGLAVVVLEVLEVPLALGHLAVPADV